MRSSGVCKAALVCVRLGALGFIATVCTAWAFANFGLELEADSAESRACASDGTWFLVDHFSSPGREEWQVGAIREPEAMGCLSVEQLREYADEEFDRRQVVEFPSVAMRPSGARF